MKTLKKISWAIWCFLSGCFATAASTGTPERARPVSEAIRYRKRAQVAEKALAEAELCTDECPFRTFEKEE